MAHLITGNRFDPKKDIPDLSGKASQPRKATFCSSRQKKALTDFKVYVVTGGTAGIGFGIAAHLLQHKASKILLLSQKEEHADEAIEELKKYGDASKVHWVQCNLKDLKGTDEVAKQLMSEKQIDAVRQSPSSFNENRALTHDLGHLQRWPRSRTIQCHK